MTLTSQQQPEPSSKNRDSDRSTQNSHEPEPILCPHCRRTATNGIKCKGICVADNDY